MATPPVLFVDDDQMLLNSMQRCLSLRLEMRTAVSGMAALELMAQEGPFSVVVTDMRMPGMDGVEFIRRARLVDDRALFVMLTGNQDKQTVELAEAEGGVFGFLNKPTDPDQITEMVQEAMRHYEAAPV